MATLDDFTKEPAIMERGEAEQSLKMTITMQTINNLSSKPFQSVELVWRHGTDGSDCVARRSNPARSLTSSHLVGLCMNRAWLSVWARRLKSFRTLSSSYFAQNFSCCSSSLSYLLSAASCFFKNTRRWLTLSVFSFFTDFSSVTTPAVSFNAKAE